MKIRVFIPQLLLMSALVASYGCATQMKPAPLDNIAEVPSVAQITNLVMSDDGTRLEIVADKPIIYTYYMLANPSKMIVDIAQTSPGTQPASTIINRGYVKKIDISKHEFGSGVLSRIEVALDDKIEADAALDQNDKRRLVVTLPARKDKIAPLSNETSVPATAAIPVTQPVETLKLTTESAVKTEDLKSEPKAAVETALVAPEPAVVKPEPVVQAVVVAPVIATTQLTEVQKNVFKNGETGLTAIRKTENGILLEFTEQPKNSKLFKLADPERLVLDAFGVKSQITGKITDVGAFNIGKVRSSSGGDKLRIVFDSTGTIPKYVTEKSGSNILIRFGEKIESVSEVSQPVVKTVQASPSAVPPPVAVPVTVTVEPKAEPVVAQTAISAEPKQEAVPAVKAVPVQAASGIDSTKVKAPIAAPVVTPVVKPHPGLVETIGFTQADGISRITVRTSGSCVADEPVKGTKGLTLAIKGCRLPANLQRALDTSSFESAIKNISPTTVSVRGKQETRINVSTRVPVENGVKREADLLIWEFKEPAPLPKVVKPVKQAKNKKATPIIRTFAPVEMQEGDVVESKPVVAKKVQDDAFALDKGAQPVVRQGKAYTGRKVTLEFSDADIKKIFQLLAEVSNQNILVSDDVTGTISLKLVNVPWDQALDVILENKGLGMQKDGNIVQIRPKSKMKSLDDEAVELRLSEEKKMPLSTVILDVNFAKIADIASQFNTLKSKRPDSSISTDVRTNKIIVADIDPNIAKMRRLLEQLDVPEKQVMIEARIVEASSSFARDLGVKWNFGYQDGSASVANINNITGSMGGVVTNILPTGTTGGVAAGMAFGKLLSNIQLDMRLSAASTVGQVKIISTPKVLTVNNSPAKISQGQMIPYQNTSSTDGAKTEFIEAALSLEVTPHITADGSVSMKIKASNNTAGVGSPPPINKKEATTELVVKNGETTVIGGIYVDSETEGDTGVPYLSDIPLIGSLFKSNSKSKTKNELLIFITPKIMN